MDLQLTGRVAIVTGASKGMGLAVTRTLLEEGAKVVAVSRRTTPELDALAGPNLLHVAADLMDEGAPARIVARAVEAFGGVDVLVNNAGGPPPGVSLPQFGFTTPDDGDWRRMFEFNLFAPVRLIREALPRLLESDAAAIVNVSTTMARQPGPMNYDYSAAKAGLANVTKGLSEEFGPQGIRVNTVSPGPVRTAWWTEEGGAADILAGATGADRDAVMDKVAPEMMNLVTGRLVEPQEVADAVVLLASPRSGSTTGAEVVVDGGSLKGL
ncbi:SDR family oxidoreductase [Actinomadura kijaniata]|uniref:NAD(P)-dependent dehydrogenase (Short-subunit alcohol dehydrogenase family) n=1 Tax=Actinomadura namibiensis TaxID=182080 RepID=A0A7W3LLL0_ACTNM|nr:SDR family oxidoreductase [Actinomadura namibiensis]MBA8950401.1 NAD(P)-dependent dehydrogenase (short-subunit alcohol dehydrogenase family) [Actinomadura namibiensis]